MEIIKSITKRIWLKKLSFPPSFFHNSLHQYIYINSTVTIIILSTVFLIHSQIINNEENCLKNEKDKIILIHIHKLSN